MNSSRLTVITVHNRYLHRGGEDVVFEAEADLLEQRGCKVIRVEVQMENPSNVREAIKIGSTALWSQIWYRKIAELVNFHEANILHIHNFWPNISPSIIYAARQADVPVVVTLHNFRLLCPAATFFRNGGVCEDCLGKILPWPAIVHSCYQQSRLASGALVGMLTGHRLIGTWTQKVDRYIAPTQFTKKKLIEGGLPRRRICVKPHFVGDWTELEMPRDGPRSGGLFVGKLTRIKGMPTLLRAWRDLPVTLEIIGDGPFIESARNRGLAPVKVLGSKSSEEIAAAMRRAAFLIVPSESYETFGLVTIEAFSHGLPVIASRLGAMAEIVDDGVTGLLFAPGDANDLAAKVRWAGEHPEEMRRMGQAARRRYEECYTPERNCRMLMAIYRETIAAVAGHGREPEGDPRSATGA